MSTDVSFGNAKRRMRVAFSEQPSETARLPRLPALGPETPSLACSSTPALCHIQAQPRGQALGALWPGLELGGLHRGSGSLAPCPALGRARDSGALGAPCSPSQAVCERKPSQHMPQTKSTPGRTGPPIPAERRLMPPGTQARFV